jgi:hypothetical protein
MITRSTLARWLPAPVRPPLRSALRLLEWLFRDMPRAPILESYIAFQDVRNRRFFRQVREERARGRDDWLVPYRPRPVPRIIWTFWAQGLAAAPPVVTACVESWRRHNPGWELRVLDLDQAGEFLDMSRLPPGVPLRYHANVLRLTLLARFGGVWADATVYCHRPLDDWLPQAAASGFFVFSDPGPDRWLDSWFIASEPQGRLVSAWREAYLNHVTRLSGTHRSYFIVMYTFQLTVLRDRALRALWQRVPRLPAPPCFLMASAIGGRTPDEAVLEAVSAGLPVSKLSWKAPVAPEELPRRLARIAAMIDSGIPARATDATAATPAGGGGR